MSTVKNQPATPLPFKQGDQTKGDDADAESIFDQAGDIVADCGARATLDGQDWPQCEQNAAYLTHAGNAYPKLVAALQKINGMIFSVWAPLGSENYFAIRGAAADTLNELGEEVR